MLSTDVAYALTKGIPVTARNRQIMSIYFIEASSSIVDQDPHPENNVPDPILDPIKINIIANLYFRVGPIPQFLVVFLSKAKML
jgi:hypothetical protein